MPRPDLHRLEWISFSWRTKLLFLEFASVSTTPINRHEVIAKLNCEFLVGSYTAEKGRASIY